MSKKNREKKDKDGKEEKKKGRKGGMTALKFLLAIVGIIVVIVIVLQIVLSPAVLTRVVNKVADNYIDGDVRFERVSVSMFRHFPNLSVNLGSVSVTYPTDRFSRWEDGSASLLLLRGKGSEADTLAAFNSLSVSVNLASLLGGTVNLHAVDLDGPKIYAKSYGDGVCNWDIVKTGSPVEEAAPVKAGDKGKKKGGVTEEEDWSDSWSPDDEAFGQKVRNKATSVKESVKEGVENVKEGVREGVESVKEVTADDVQDAVASTVAGAITDRVDDRIAAQEGESEDSAGEDSGSGIPDITVGRVRLHNNPVIVLCSVPDSLYATVGLRNMVFRGKLTTKDLYKNKIGFKVDSMYVAGRMREDSLALGLQKFAIRQNKGAIDLDLLAGIRLASGSMGRMSLPLSVKSSFSFPKDSVPSISVKSLQANFAGIPLKATADVKYYQDRFLVTADASVDKCRVKDVIDNFGKNFWPDATNFKTDATLTLNAFVNGWYCLDGSEIPQVKLTVDIPDTPIVNRKMKLDSNIGLSLWANGGGTSNVDVGIDDFHFTGNAIKLNFNGSASDLTGGDPQIKVDADLSVALDSLAFFIRKEWGMDVSGDVFAKAKGGFRMSQLDVYEIAGADLMGYVRSDRLEATSAKDSLCAHLDSLSVIFGTKDNTKDSTIEIGTRLMSLGAKLDSVYVTYGSALALHGSDLHLSGWSDAAILDKEDNSSYYPISGTVKIGSLFLTDSDATQLTLLGSENKFTVKPQPKDKEIPVVTLTSDNRSFRGRAGYNRLAFGDLNLSLTAAKTGAKRQKMARALADSLARRHPEIQRDSLFSFVRREAGSKELPDWLTEEDFRKSDLDFKLDESIAKYYRDWDFDGKLGLDRAILITPSLPLRNTMTKVSMNVNNDAFTLVNMTVKSGKSDLSAKGQLSGMKNGLLNNGTISLKMDISSKDLNLNEMLTAYTLGQKITAKLDSLSGKADALDDDQYMDMVAVDTISGNTAPESALIVIPANLEADLKLNASKVTYSVLNMDSMHSDITMKERCVQLVNTAATSDVGNLTLEAFYSTKTKEDITAGFNLAFEDITAEKILDLMPAVDSIMPVLKSFRGNLDCMLAATAQIDTTMSIMLPTLNGVLRIKGQNLALVESEDLYKIAKILRFSDVTNIQIDDMSVEALISDSKVEIFPFILSTGKYKLAMSGVQNLDQSFSYHASVIKSPLLIRFGVNFTGPDFENMKFKIGKAMYKDENVGVFSAVIDETRLSLSDAIRNIFSSGIDAAVRESKEHKQIERRRKELNYVDPSQGDIEDLSSDESDILEGKKFIDSGDPDDGN